MKRATFVILFIYTLILLLSVINLAAQETPNEQAASGLSGKVVDIEGTPVAGYSFMVQPIDVIDGFPHPVAMDPRLNAPSFVIVKTGADGVFKAVNIRPGMVQIDGIPDIILETLKNNAPDIPQQAQLPNIEVADMMRVAELMMKHRNRGNKSEMQIVSIALNNITFYPVSDIRPFDGLTFGLKPGHTINDVKIKVKQLLKIRAQIVYANGTPVANADAELSVRHRGGEFVSASGTYGTSCTTDAKGYFTEYREYPGYYTLSIEYKPFKGGAGPFLINKGVHPESIVIKLDGNPEKKKEVEQDLKQRVVEVPKVVKALQPNPQLPQKLVWIINPANGHAYAQVNCRGWYDAQEKAIAEEAHLLSINDEAELIWVQIMFREPHYWIGLNDVEKEGVWQWDSGEPVTYTNWAEHEMFGGDEPDTEKDFVAVTHFQGGWQAVSENHPLWRITRMAVIEKDGMISKVPEPEKETDEE